MHVPTRSAVLASAALLCASISGAQARDAVAAPACVETTSAGSLAGCPLELADGEVRRAGDWRIIARDGRLHVMPLSSIVDGDSARSYALQYEHEARIARRLLAVSYGLLAGSAAVALSYRCGGHTLGGCSNPSDGYVLGAASLLAAGLGTALAQIPFRGRAMKAAERAIMWHNAGAQGRR